MSYEIKFLYRSDDPISVDVKDAIVKGLKAGRLRPAAVRHHRRRQLHAACRPRTRTINVRSAGWCSDWPSGGSWFPPVFQSTNIEDGGSRHATTPSSEKASTTRSTTIQRLADRRAAGAWNELDKDDRGRPTSRRSSTGYDGVAMMHGSKVHEHVRTTRCSACRPGRTCGCSPERDRCTGTEPKAS